MGTVRNALQYATLAGLVLLGANNAHAQDTLSDKIQDQGQQNPTHSGSKLYELLKSYVGQDGRIKRDFYHSSDLSLDKTGNFGNFVCENYNIGEVPLTQENANNYLVVACFPIAPFGSHTKDAFKMPILSHATWYLYQGEWYVDKPNGLGGDEVSDEHALPNEENKSPELPAQNKFIKV